MALDAARLVRASLLLASALGATVASSVGASAQSVATPGCSFSFPGDTSGFAPFAAQTIGGVVGATNAITSVIGTMNTAFLAQGNAFVAGLPNPQADQTSGGIWGRMIGGNVTTSFTGTFNGAIDSTNLGGGATPGSVNCNSQTRMNYAGFQLGQDIARLNIGGSGATLHVGVTGGYAEANAQDTGGSHFTGNFEIPFAGLYAVYTNGRFFADIMGRADFYQSTITSAPAGLQNQRLNGLGGTVSASAGYRLDIGGNWFVEPSGSLVYSKVNLDTLMLPGGFGDFNNNFFLPQGSVKFAPNESILGRIGARVGTTYSAANITWQPFAAASVWHEFAGNTTANYSTNADSFGTFTDPSVSGTISGSRVGTYGQYSLGVAAQADGSPLLGYLRVDYKQGSNLESLGFNGGLRYNFDPLTGFAAKPAGIFKARPLATAVAYDWSGFYAGGFAGAGFGNSNWSFPETATGANSRIAGALLGGDIGYNKQFGSWVVGAEADVAVTNAKGGQGCIDGINNVGFPITANCNNDLKWMATATGKLGYAWDRVLAYGKAGGAWTSNKLDGSCNGDPDFIFNNFGGCTDTNAFTTGKLTQNLVSTLGQFGWTVGAGFELALTPAWSAKVEYDYMNFGSKSVVLPDTTVVNLKQDFNQVKVGVNYHFGRDEIALASAMPVKAAPAALFNWTGVYVGAALADRASAAAWQTTAVSDGGGGLLPPDPTTTPASFSSSNAQARLYTGYNWQFSPKWVLGIEGDVGNGNSRRTVAGIPGTFGNGNQTAFGIETQQHDSASVKTGWDGTIRGKLGMLVTPTILFYGTGGAAFQQVQVSATCDAFFNGFTGAFDSWCTTAPHNQSFSSIRTGWTAGLGIEGVLSGNWIGKVEARYADFGHVKNTFFANGADDVVTDVHVQTFTALAGISYKFGPTAAVAAKY